MKEIFKYELHPSEISIIEMPHMAEILSVQMHDGELKIWALVEEEAPMQKRIFYILWTGYEFPSHINEVHKRGLLKHHATVQSGPIVLHVFEDITTQEYGIKEARR